MMINSVKITVFAKNNEGIEKIKEKLLWLVSINLEKENIQLNQKRAIGFNEKEIKIFEVLLTKEKSINKFLEHLIKNLRNETKELILKHAEKRLDDECNFFLRFSKDKLINENELWITDAGNCFHIKMNIASFPKKKEEVMEIIRNVFKV